MTARSEHGSPGEAQVLRPEARPLPYVQLDEQQQVALQRVVGLLTTAVQAASTPMSDRAHTARALASLPGPYLESARSSRNILIGGERGTGKTTLMLSLAGILATERDAELDQNLPEGVAGAARALRRRLVWLETLDMEPLASEANLLGAVLARLEDAVGARFPGFDNPVETVSLVHPGVGFHDMSRELARLQTSVALTFGGNLGKRSGSLDPDTFAVESRRAERERMGLDRRFASVLAGLSSAVASTTELTAPVFVLPVDDIDLNVSECVPLLRLLRATSAPHLIVVLAADVGLLSTIMLLSYQGELARISTPVPLRPEDTKVAADLAINALRKHLPPAQRVVLGLVEPGRALAWKPLESSSRSVGQVLGPIELPADSAALEVTAEFDPTLSGAAMQPVLTTPCWSAGQEEEAGKLTERLAPFSWPQVLRLPLRQLVDLYLDCTGRTEQHEHRPRAQDVADSPLVKLARERLQAVLPRTQWTEQPTAGYSISFSHQWGPVVTQPGESPTVGHPAWPGWQPYIQSGRLDTTETAVLVGCIELLGSEWEYRTYGPLPTPPAIGAARRTTWAANTTGIAWPWVTHTTFWGYERALAWLNEADGLWSDEQDAEFGSWVAVMTAQLFNAPATMQPFDRPTLDFAANWNALADRLDGLRRTQLAQAWLDAVGLLCTPEMGMSSSVARLVPDWRAENVRMLRTARAARLASPLKEKAESSLAEEKSQSETAAAESVMPDGPG